MQIGKELKDRFNGGRGRKKRVFRTYLSDLGKEIDPVRGGTTKIGAAASCRRTYFSDVLSNWVSFPIKIDQIGT